MIFNIARLLFTIPEVLNGALHTRDCNFIKSPLVTNDVGNVPEKKGLLFAECVEHKGQRGLTSHAQTTGWCPGFNLGE